MLQATLVLMAVKGPAGVMIGSVAVFTSSSSSVAEGQELGLVEEPRERFEADEFAAAPSYARAAHQREVADVLVDRAVEALDVEVAPGVAGGEVVEHLVRPVVVVDVLDELAPAEHPQPAEEHARPAQGAELVVAHGVVVDELEAELDGARF